MAYLKNQLNLKEQVFETVKKIPRGRVATYGQIAAMIHSGSVVRSVGNALHQNNDPNVPCHRVVDRNGRLAPNFAFDGVEEQRRRLVLEGVKFKDDMHVDLDDCLWHA